MFSFPSEKERDGIIPVKSIKMNELSCVEKWKCLWSNDLMNTGYQLDRKEWSKRNNFNHLYIYIFFFIYRHDLKKRQKISLRVDGTYFPSFFFPPAIRIFIYLYFFFISTLDWLSADTVVGGACWHTSPQNAWYVLRLLILKVRGRTYKWRKVLLIFMWLYLYLALVEVNVDAL